MTTKPIPSWSFHRLVEFEKCPYSVYLSAVEKHKPPKSEALDRGLRLHDEAEGYVKGNRDQLEEIETFQDDFNWLRDQYQQNLAMAEDDWAFTTDWTPTGWFADDTWCRMKLDALVQFTPAHALTIDYKTGKPNKIKHTQQGQLYVVGAFLQQPALEQVDVEFWYLDHDTKSKRMSYTRDQAEAMRKRWHIRGMALTNAVNFPPRPSRMNCKFCDHKPICQFAAED